MLVNQLQHYELQGWCWSIGYSYNLGGYYARVWRDIKPIRVDGKWIYRNCITESGATIDEAIAKLLQRINGL